MSKYRRISHVPDGLRWDVPRRHQGQDVEVAYATPNDRYEQDDGAIYRREIDHSDPAPCDSAYYYRRVDGRFVLEVDRQCDGSSGWDPIHYYDNVSVAEAKLGHLRQAAGGTVVRYRLVDNEDDLNDD